MLAKAMKSQTSDLNSDEQKPGEERTHAGAIGGGVALACVKSQPPDASLTAEKRGDERLGSARSGLCDWRSLSFRGWMDVK